MIADWIGYWRYPESRCINLFQENPAERNPLGSIILEYTLMVAAVFLWPPLLIVMLFGVAVYESRRAVFRKSELRG
jgi:hypothetical protein